MSDLTPLDVEAIRARLDAPDTALGANGLETFNLRVDAAHELRQHAPTDLRRLLDENARLNAELESLRVHNGVLVTEVRFQADRAERMRVERDRAINECDDWETKYAELSVERDALRRALPAAPEMPRPPAEEALEGVMSPAEEAALAIRMRHQGTCQQNGALLKMWCSCRGWEQMLLLGPSEPEVLYKAFAGHVSEMVAEGARLTAQPGAGGTETLGTGSGKGTGVAESAGPDAEARNG